VDDNDNILKGVPASPGLGVGTIVQHRPAEIAVTEAPSGTPEQEQAKLDEAIAAATLQLDGLRQKMVDDADPSKAAIFVAHGEIVKDRAMLKLAKKGIEGGKSAEFAWNEAFTTYADKLAGMKNDLFAERANDVRDVGRRVLGILTGHDEASRELPDQAILVAEELTPSDTAQLDRSKVVGFATTTGGASSHVAIIARSLDIPAVAGIDARALEIADGQRVVLDGSNGTLQMNLDDEQISAILERRDRIAAKKQADMARAFDEATTTDGHKVDVVANIGNLKDAEQAMTFGAEGVGLLRSEFIFLDRSEAPSEDEQAQIYADIARALKPGQPLVIRTLDVGGDKPLPYLPIPPEENPFLGIRGVRIAFDRPEVLRTQCRAILKAADAGAHLHVMFPMIATLEDYRQAKAIFDEEAKSLGVDNVPLGIMVEVPSVAVMADQFAKEVDFFSVGTNDLTSYTLAMDRGHAKLAPQVDPCNPAVLALIGRAAEAAHKYGKWLGICGGVASDPQAVPILVGLGVDELSCSIPAIPAVKAQVRAWSLDECKALAEQAVACDTAAAVRALVPLADD